MDGWDGESLVGMGRRVGWWNGKGWWDGWDVLEDLICGFGWEELDWWVGLDGSNRRMSWVGWTGEDGEWAA
jgi:hypothetical protein